MINIANLLRNAKKGTILWSPLFGPVEFMKLGKNDQIWVKVDNSEPFDKYGRYFGSRFTEAECLLFPSKDCRDWENFNLPTKPMFKVGDWAIDKYITDCVFQITKILDNSYEITEKDGHVTNCLQCDIEDNSRLWTIADIKDGDVLATTTGSCPFIYRKTGYNNDLAYYYAGIDGSGNFCEGCLKRTLYHFGPVEEVVPATREQRDLLFQKMKEASYTWDADKKELRKVVKEHYDISNFYAGMPVLVRETSLNTWQYVHFSHCYTGGDGLTRFNAGLIGFTQCIPFNEKTKHLLGTTDMPDEKYINW